VRQLVPEHDRQLVVRQIVDQSRVHPDRAVAHRRGVPLVGLDDVDAGRLAIEIRRHQPGHDPAYLIGLPPLAVRLADDLAPAVLLRLEHHALAEPHRFDLVGRLPDVVLEERGAIRLRLDLGRLQRAIGEAHTLELDLVAERNGFQ